MNHDWDKIEQDLKRKAGHKKEQKKSGRSVFKLQEIIKKKSKPKEDLRSLKNNE